MLSSCRAAVQRVDVLIGQSCVALCEPSYGEANVQHPSLHGQSPGSPHGPSEKLGQEPPEVRVFSFQSLNM